MRIVVFTHLCINTNTPLIFSLLFNLQPLVTTSISLLRRSLFSTKHLLVCSEIPKMTVSTTTTTNIQSKLISTTTEAAHHVDYIPGSGELIWRRINNTNNNDVPVAKTKTSEIIFILKTDDDSSSSGNGSYLIYTLSENIDPAANTNTNTDDLYKLSVLHSLQELPGEILENYLLDLGNLGLLSDEKSLLDVIISTGSGTGKSKVFYDTVLGLLLGAVGLSEKGDNDGNEEKSKGYRVTVTTSPRTITEYASQIQDDYDDDNGGGQRTIILLSGDGGVIDLLNGLDTGAAAEKITPQPTVAILPLGTGNALFHSLHKPLYDSTSDEASAAPSPSNLVLGLRTLFTGIAKPLPTFKASFSPRSKLISAPALEKVAGATSTSTSPTNENDDDNNKEVFIDHLIGGIVASYGFHASLVWESDTPAYRVHGDKRFGMAAAELLKVSHGYETIVEIRKTTGKGKKEWQRVPRDKFNYVLTTLVSNLEKTFTISPDSKPLDGQLRLVHFGDVGGERTMDIMRGAYAGGEHVGMRWRNGTGEGEDEWEDGVGYEEVDEVRVTILEDDPRWRKVCIDGTIVEIEKGGWMSVAREPVDEGRERIKVVVNKDVVPGK